MTEKPYLWRFRFTEDELNMDVDRLYVPVEDGQMPGGRFGGGKTTIITWGNE